MQDMNSEKLRHALLVSVERVGDDLRIRLDDVESKGQSTREWSQREHFIHKVYSEATLLEADFSKDELANIGAYVIARLAAYVRLNEV